MTSTDTGLTSTFCALILGTNVIPQTTLASQATAGSTTVSLTDASHFLGASSSTDSKGLLMFNDGLGEEPWAFTKSGNVLTLNTQGTGNTGLVYTHTAGTTVYTNLFDFAPNKIDNLLSLGDPVVWVFCDQETYAYRGMRTMIPTYRFCIRYAIPIYRPNAESGLNTNIWTRRQQRRARQDVETIADAIRQNPTLRVSGNEFAVDLGRMGSSRSKTTRKNWQMLIRQNDSRDLQADLTVTVTGQLEGITAP